MPSLVPVLRTDLMEAAFSGDVVRVHEALARGDDLNASDAQGWTAITFAVMGHHPDVVALLLEAGADGNRQAHDGATALMKASLWGDAASVAVLLRHGVNPCAVDADGWSAEAIATQQRRDDIVHMLKHATNTDSNRGEQR